MARALTQRHRDTEVAKVRLGDCFDLQMGKTPARANDSYWGGANKWISIADIGKAGQYIGETKEYITDKAVRESGIKQIPANTLLMSFKLSIGKATITKEPMFSNEAIMAFFPKNPAEVDLHYFYHQISNKDWSDGMNRAVVGLTLNKKSLQEHKLVLPSLAEQKRIAGELDRICELKKNAEERLALMDQLVKSKFVEMFGDPVANPFGWKMRKISEFADVKIGPFGSVLHKEDYVSGGHPLVNPSHMKDGQICVDDDLTLTDEKYNELEVYHLRIGDVVVARRGEIGRCALVGSDGLFCGTGSMFVRVKGDCRPDYLQRVISFPTYTAKLEFGAVGVTMKNINAGMIEDSLVPLPPMPLQESFAAFVSSVDKSKAALKETIETMETLYKERLQEYFA